MLSPTTPFPSLFCDIVAHFLNAIRTAICKVIYLLTADPRVPSFLAMSPSAREQ